MLKSHLPQMAVLSLSILMVVAALPAAAEIVDESNLYPFTTCPVSGAKLDAKGAPTVKDYDGREVRFCCNSCPKAFAADKDKYLKKIDDEIVKEQEPLYPLDTCVVSGQKLGGMGEAVNYVYKNRLIRFCCKGCEATFKKDPETYLKKLDEAVLEKQKADYPMDTCVVSGKKLGDGEVDIVVDGKLVRLCCPNCLKQVEKDPAGTLDKIYGMAKAGG